MEPRSLKVSILATAAALLACAWALGVVATANAAPTATAEVKIKPLKHLYQQVARPVNATFNGTVTPGAGQTTLNPLMETKFRLPGGLRFTPDRKMPKCHFTDASANVPTDTALNMCRKALVGNGTASLYIAQSVAAKVDDPRILIFNAGYDNHGNGKIVMQAYSSSTNAGITFSGKTANGILDVRIPRLTYDSSVPSYSLSIPGTHVPGDPGPPPAAALPAGRDKGFVQARCASGKFKSSATFFLGDRDASGNVSNRQKIKTSPYVEKCKGRRGKPKFKRLRVKGPGHVRHGRRATYRVTLVNRGTRTAKNVRISARGGGKGYCKAGKILPGTHKNVKVKVRIKGPRGQRTTIRFKAAAKSAKSFGKLKVRVGGTPSAPAPRPHRPPPGVVGLG